MMSDKIRQHHLDRRAILYVRQSSSHQVLHNRESRRLQYAMRERLVALGWSEIDVIDDDLGRSAAGGVMRAGFERMVAEVCLGKVGAVAAREVSRFARNSRDWQQLIEMCRVVDTVLIDQVERSAASIAHVDNTPELLPTSDSARFPPATRRPAAANWSWPPRSDSSRPATGWRRIPIAAGRRRSAWSSTKWLNWAARGRRFCGSTSTVSTCPPGAAMATSPGDGLATRRSIGW